MPRYSIWTCRSHLVLEWQNRDGVGRFEVALAKFRDEPVAKTASITLPAVFDRELRELIDCERYELDHG